MATASGTEQDECHQPWHTMPATADASSRSWGWAGAPGEGMAPDPCTPPALRWLLGRAGEPRGWAGQGGKGLGVAVALQGHPWWQRVVGTRPGAGLFLRTGDGDRASQDSCRDPNLPWPQRGGGSRAASLLCIVCHLHLGGGCDGGVRMSCRRVVRVQLSVGGAHHLGRGKRQRGAARGARAGPQPRPLPRGSCGPERCSPRRRHGPPALRELGAPRSPRRAAGRCPRPESGAQPRC